MKILTCVVSYLMKSIRCCVSVQNFVHVVSFKYCMFLLSFFIFYSLIVFLITFVLFYFILFCIFLFALGSSSKPFLGPFLHPFTGPNYRPMRFWAQVQAQQAGLLERPHAYQAIKAQPAPTGMASTAWPCCMHMHAHVHRNGLAHDPLLWSPHGLAQQT